MDGWTSLTQSTGLRLGPGTWGFRRCPMGGSQIREAEPIGQCNLLSRFVSFGRFPWVGGMSEIAFALDRGFGVVQRAER